MIIMTIWNTRQGHNDRVRVSPAESPKRIWGTGLCIQKQHTLVLHTSLMLLALY